jgi:S1-C subfamily serine protease
MKEVFMSFSGINGLVALSQSMAETVEQLQSSLVYIHTSQNFPISGFVFTDETVLTTNQGLHDGKETLVTLPGGERISALLAGRAPEHNLALLRLPGTTLQPVDFLDDRLRIGELVIAVGRPDPAGIQATLGVISRIAGPLKLENGAILEETIHTDATPFPGFSGGPLVNANRKIVGINTTNFEWAQFSTIPIRIAIQIAKSLEQYGRIRRGYLGIRSQKVRLYPSHRKELGRPQVSGLVIIRVEPDSPAARANLMEGDVITGINGQVVQYHTDLLAQLSSSSINQTLLVEMLRGSHRLIVHVPVREHR